MGFIAISLMLFAAAAADAREQSDAALGIGDRTPRRISELYFRVEDRDNRVTVHWGSSPEKMELSYTLASTSEEMTSDRIRIRRATKTGVIIEHDGFECQVIAILDRSGKQVFVSPCHNSVYCGLVTPPRSGWDRVECREDGQALMSRHDVKRR
ncbi:MAG: hypothetical protein AAF654_11405 [Myxococcota bacterium]